MGDKNRPKTNLSAGYLSDALKLSTASE